MGFLSHLGSAVIHYLAPFLKVLANHLVEDMGWNMAKREKKKSSGLSGKEKVVCGWGSCIFPDVLLTPSAFKSALIDTFNFLQCLPFE